jgi:hypothetical protein
MLRPPLILLAQAVDGIQVAEVCKRSGYPNQYKAFPSERIPRPPAGPDTDDEIDNDAKCTELVFFLPIGHFGLSRKSFASLVPLKPQEHTRIL